MSGSLIVPGMIPGTDIDATEISASATSYRTTSTSIGTSADAVLTSWSGLSASYTAPESPTLLAAMDPAGVDAHLIADKLSRSADLLDDLASAVVAPVRRLKELKTEAEDFVASVRNGVTVDYYDPDNTLNQANQMSGTPVYIPEGEGEQTLDWSEHTPSVNRNNELLEQVAAEVAKLSAACATCVNGINALRDDMCVAPQQAVTAEQILASDELPWGATGKGNRSCNESIGDGIFEFGKSVVGGGAALLGFDIDHDWAHSGDFAAQAWTGLASGLGALVVTVVPPASVLLSLPTSITPEWAHGAQDWYQGTMRGMVEGIVGTPEQWEEDPVAAGTYAVLSIGTFFIPGAGQAGAGVKVAGVLARAGVAAERIAVIAADGSRLANGLVRAGTVFERLSVAVDGLTGVSRSVRGLDDVAHALDEIPDVVPDNLTPRVGAEHPHADVHIDNGDGTPVTRSSDSDGSATRAERGTTLTEERPGGGGGSTDPSPTGGGRGSDSTSDSSAAGGSDGARAPETVGQRTPPPSPDVFDPARPSGFESGDPLRPGEPVATVPPADFVPGSGEPGWAHINPGARDGWVDYQLQIAGVERTADGRVPEWVEHGTGGNTVKFDGHTYRGHPPVEVLLDAKDGYRGLAFGNLTEGYWEGRATSIIKQAGRQLDAAPEGSLIEWHVSDPYGAAAIRRLLAGRGITADDILVVYTPKR